MTRRLRRVLARLTPRAARPRLRRAFRNARFRAGTRVGRSPVALSLVHARLAGYRERLADAGTEILIEGAPRVGLTYCVHAFVRAQGRPVRVATHTHLPASVLRAVRERVPALVVIRDPAEALRSTLLRNRDLTIRAVLERYLAFYRCVERARDRVVLADFEEVIADAGAVVERVNRRFGTRFLPYARTAPDEAAVLAQLHERDRLLALDPLGSFLPSPSKAAARRAIRVDPRDPLLRRCNTLYRRLSPRFGPALGFSRAGRSTRRP